MIVKSRSLIVRFDRREAAKGIVTTCSKHFRQEITSRVQKW